MAERRAVVELNAVQALRAHGVDRLDITVGTGEVFGFLGPNGAGKTTTLRCFVGLLRPTEGQARVPGLDPIADHRRLASSLGFLTGELRLYPEFTGRQTLRLLADLRGTPTSRQGGLRRRLGLPGAALSRAVREYSRGMKQRLGLVQGAFFELREALARKVRLVLTGAVEQHHELPGPRGQQDET